MPIHPDIHAYNAAQSAGDKRICDALARAIDKHLTGVENKIWQRHPVWFLDGNPIVGYSKLKDCIRLLFWSGQSFDEPGLAVEGTFKAAEARYTSADQIVLKDLQRWLEKAIAIQWDYKNIVKRKGKLVRLPGGNLKTDEAASKVPKRKATVAASKKADAKTKVATDWRAETLARVRRLIQEADPQAVEEVKWRKPSNPAGVPVWSHDGILCTGETYKNAVKLTFAKGASLPDPAGLFNSSLEGNTRRAIDIREGEKINEKALTALVRAAVALNTSASTRTRKIGTNK
jgi:hypothetical protein